MRPIGASRDRYRADFSRLSAPAIGMIVTILVIGYAIFFGNPLDGLRLQFTKQCAGCRFEFAKAEFSHADLAGANLSNANISGASFRNANWNPTAMRASVYKIHQSKDDESFHYLQELFGQFKAFDAAVADREAAITCMS
jgi:uncharacterized protein YjbI with pentapeptide repeats